MHAELGATYHQRVGDVVAAITDIGQSLTGELTELLLHGEHICQDLRRVPVIGETIPHRHAGVLSQGLDRLVGKPTELDAVEHAAQDPRGVGNGLFLSELNVALAQVLGMRSLVDAGYGESTAGPGRRLFEEQSNVPAVEPAFPDAGPLLGLQIGGESQQRADLIGREIEQLEERSSFQINGHRRLQTRIRAGEYYPLRPSLPSWSSVCLIFSPAHVGRGRARK